MVKFCCLIKFYLPALLILTDSVWARNARCTEDGCTEDFIGPFDSTSALQKQALDNMPAVGELTQVSGHQTQYQIQKEGNGAFVQKGNTVTVHATGVVGETGQKFWSTKDPGQQPFTYKAGVGQVIVGWDQGLLGMKINEERKVIIPGAEGYGPSGFPAWGIPPNATLEFTLEVLKIQ